jgi:hypothetical protein
MAPFRHYLAAYREKTPQEIAARCAIPFDAGSSAFSLRVVGRDYSALFPDFALTGAYDAGYSEQLLLLRYLCEGVYRPWAGRMISYGEVPWGEVYLRNFTGRCVKRLASAFGNDIAALTHIMESNPALGAERLQLGDASFRFRFMRGLCMSIVLWAGDEEFPPSAQILFDDNFPAAFSAEDIAVAGEVVIGRLNALRKKNALPEEEK